MFRKGLFQSSYKSTKIRDMSLTITDFILIYNLIPLFCLDFSIPIASLDSSLLRLNQLTCDTPSIVKSNFPFSSSLMEQTERLASKLWLNSEE